MPCRVIYVLENIQRVGTRFSQSPCACKHLFATVVWLHVGPPKLCFESVTGCF